MRIRLLLSTLLLAVVSSTAAAQPSAGWSLADPPAFAVVADLTDTPGLEAVYWEPFGNSSTPFNLLSISLATGQSLGALPRQFAPSFSTVYSLGLDPSLGTSSVVVFEANPNTGQARAGAYYGFRGTWVESWYTTTAFDFSSTDLQMVTLANANGPYLMEVGGYLRLHDPLTGAAVWSSDEFGLGIGPEFGVRNWTLADYDGDSQGNELLIEVIDTSPGSLGTISLWMVSDLALATGVNPFRSTRISLGRSRPNPMFGETTIQFEIAESAPVHLRIVDARGRVVATVAQQTMSAGKHMLRWDGRDDRGIKVSQGVYFYELSAAGQRQSRKMIVLR